MKTPARNRPFHAGRLALVLLLLSPGILAAQDASSAFDAANRLYEQGKFADAKMAYSRLAGTGPWSANLFYNLGNAEWKLGDPGAAALDYERALALEPSHAEARANLDFVRNQTGAKTISRPWWQETLAVLPSKAATLLAALCAWAVLFSLASWSLRRGARSPAPLLAAGVAVLAGAFAGGALWFDALDAAKGVVVAKSVQARWAPAEAAPMADLLPAGSEVLAPEVRGEWTYCTLPGGVRAWVATDAVQRVALAAQ